MSRVYVSIFVALFLLNFSFSQIPSISSRNFPLFPKSYALDSLEITPIFEPLNLGLLNLGYGMTPAEDFLMNVNFKGSNISYHNRINYFLVDPYIYSFDVKSPLTIFEYQNGQYGEEYFSVLHAQNININNVFYFRYRSVSNDEFFLNSQNSTNIFSLNLNGQDESNRLFWNTHFNYGMINQKLFHGIRNPEQFVVNGYQFSPLQYLVNTPDAISKSYDLKIKHQMMYRLGHNLKNDSLDSPDTIPFSINYIMHHVDVDQGIFGYSDPYIVASDSLDNWYNNLAYGDLTGNIRLWTRQISSKVEYVIQRNSKVLLFDQFITRLGFKSVGYTWGELANSMNNYGLYLDLSGDFSSVDSVFFSYQNEIGFGGINAGDFNLQGRLQKFYSNYSLGIDYHILRREPNLIYSNLRTDFFQINNSFNKEFLSSFGVDLKYLGFSLSNRIFLFNNLVYLNDVAFPSQTLNITYQNTSSVQWEWQTTRLGGNISGNYQFIGGEDVLRVPSIFAKSQLFLKGKLFNRVLDFKTGINVYYFSEFKANQFFGPLMDFYLQNENEIGGYPFADFFVHLKLKTGRIFINIFHPHAGLIGNDYFFRYGYPQQGFMLRIGANWILQD